MSKTSGKYDGIQCPACSHILVGIRAERITISPFDTRAQRACICPRCGATWEEVFGIIEYMSLKQSSLRERLKTQFPVLGFEATEVLTWILSQLPEEGVE